MRAAVRFLVLGALLLALRTYVDGGVPERAPIVIGAEEIARARAEWRGEHGRAPDAAEEAALVTALADDEVLYREATALELAREQPIVRDRLASLARFVGEGPTEDEEALARAARTLGLDRTDLIVRRHLARTMRLALGSRDPRDLPDDAALERHLRLHAEEFRAPERTRLTHVFLSAARRGPRLWSDAEALLARLRREETDRETAPALGDPCIVGAHVGPAAANEIERTFGAGFSGAVSLAPPAEWIGPVRSAWGVHLVWIHDRTPGGVPPLDAVRSRVLHAVLAERRDEQLREGLAKVRKRYRVAVAGE